MVRWSLQTLDGTGTYTFAMSPGQMDSPFRVKGVQAHGKMVDGVSLGTRLDTPHDWSFSGAVLVQADYQALTSWVGVKCYLTDHLSRKFLVRLKKFDAVRAPTLYAPWRHTYKMSVTTYGGPL